MSDARLDDIRHRLRMWSAYEPRVETTSDIAYLLRLLDRERDVAQHMVQYAARGGFPVSYQGAVCACEATSRRMCPDLWAEEVTP